MSETKTILVAGTYDTKDDELNFIAEVIRGQGGAVLSMDLSVLGDPSAPTDISKHAVAEAGGSSIEVAIDSGDENRAMQIMAQGAAAKALELYRAGRIDGVIVLGGTMGTDLAPDLCAALPLGVPKYVVSTVAFSPLLPPGRIPADVQMILWAGSTASTRSARRRSARPRARCWGPPGRRWRPTVTDR